MGKRLIRLNTRALSSTRTDETRKQGGLRENTYSEEGFNVSTLPCAPRCCLTAEEPDGLASIARHHDGNCLSLGDTRVNSICSSWFWRHGLVPSNSLRSRGGRGSVHCTLHCFFAQYLLGYRVLDLTPRDSNTTPSIPAWISRRIQIKVLNAAEAFVYGARSLCNGTSR